MFEQTPRGDTPPTDLEGLCAQVLDLEGRRRRLDREIADALAAVESGGGTDEWFGHLTGNWLAAATNLPGVRCRARVDAAVVATEHFPQLLDALGAGQIAWEHVEVIVGASNDRIAESFARRLPDLIRDAGQRSFERWRSDVRATADRLDRATGGDPDARPDRLGFTPQRNGTTKLAGRFGPDSSETLSSAVEHVADELLRQAERDREQSPELTLPSRSELRARALVELARRGLAVDLASSKPPIPEVTLVLRPNPLGRLEGLTTLGHTINLDLLSSWWADPIWQILRVDSDGVPLSLNRTQRYFTKQQRIALTERDGGCVFAGCTTPATWCDAHHIWAWDIGGPTDITNGVLLCRHHHMVTHRNGWELLADPGGWFHWTTPTGGVIYSQRHFTQTHPALLNGPGDRPTEPPGAAA